jgi:PAS domain-containing protein
MQSAEKNPFSILATDGERPSVRASVSSAAIGVESARDVHAELNLLNEIFRMLPTGITVQDEHGRFLLVNDAAAARLKVSAEDLLAASSPLATTELIMPSSPRNALPTDMSGGRTLTRTGRFASPTQNCC